MDRDEHDPNDPEPIHPSTPPDRDPADVPEWMEKTFNALGAIARGIERAGRNC